MFVNKYLIVKPLSAYLKQKNSVTEFLRFYYSEQQFKPRTKKTKQHLQYIYF